MTALLSVLQTLECLLGKYFGFLELGLFVIRSAEADRNEGVSLQNIKRSAESIADPISLVSEASDIFRRRSFFLLAAAMYLGLLVFIRIKLLFPEISWAPFARVSWIALYNGQVHRFAKLGRRVETLRHAKTSVGARAILCSAHRRSLGRLDLVEGN